MKKQTVKKEVVTKMYLARTLSEEMNISIAKADEFISNLVKHITDEVMKGKRVEIRSFGSFEGIERKARNGMNFVTKKVIELPAYTKFTFKASKKIRKFNNK